MNTISGYRLVHVTSSNCRKELPEFEGILYKARDEPVPGELTYTSEDCSKLKLAGYPICIEHNRGSIQGAVGVIVESSFQPPDLKIRGVINTPHVRVREQVRHMLRSGELSELSIGFVALEEPDGSYSHKLFKEASLVSGGYYSGTRLVAVQASGKNADSGVQSSGPLMVDNESDLLKLLDEKQAENATKTTSSSGDARSTQGAESSYISNSKTTSNTHEATGHARTVRVTASNQPGESQGNETIFAREQASVMEQAKQSDQQQQAPPPVDQPDAVAADEQQVAPPAEAAGGDKMDTGDVDDVDTSGKTRQEAINSWREAFDRQQKMSSEQIAAAKREASKKDEELEELRAFKRAKVEEYKAAQKKELERVHGLLDKAGLADAKDVFSTVSANPDFKNVWDATKFMAREADAKDAEIAELKKRFNALKRQRSQMSGVAAGDAAASQAVAVKSSRVTTSGNSMYGAQAMAGSTLYDVLRNKSSSAVQVNAGSGAPPTSNQPLAAGQRGASNDMPTGGAPQDFGNQSVVGMSTDDVEMHMQQYAQQQERMHAESAGGANDAGIFVRPVHKQVYAQCSRGVVEHMALKEAESRQTGFFKNSMREVAPELFDQLLAMDRSGAMPVIDTSVVDSSLIGMRFSGKSQQWAQNYGQ